MSAYNDRRCEEAKEPKCVCHCGGAAHGKRHQRSLFDDRERRCDPPVCFGSRADFLAAAAR